MKEIKLTKGFIKLVDDKDFDYLNQWKWCVLIVKGSKTFYAKRGLYIKETQETGVILMHREILRLSNSQTKADHIDHNGLNNQRGNLRIATHSQNVANASSRKNSSSKYLGVYWDKIRNKWAVEITKNYKKRYLGHFKTENEAATAYNDAAKVIHGQFANLNII